MKPSTFILPPEALDALRRDARLMEQVRRQSRHALAVELLAWRSTFRDATPDGLDVRALVAQAQTQAAEGFAANVSVSAPSPEQQRQFGRGLYIGLAIPVFHEITAGMLDRSDDELTAEVAALDRLDMLDRYRANTFLMNNARQHCRYHLSRALLDHRLAGEKPVLGPNGIKRLSRDAMLAAAESFTENYRLSHETDKWDRWRDNIEIFEALTEPHLSEFLGDLFIAQPPRLAFETARAGIYVLNTDKQYQVTFEAIDDMAREGGRLLLEARRNGLEWERLPELRRDGLRIY